MVNQKKIHSQCLSDNPEERIHALEGLNKLFSSMPNKKKAWDDLIRLTKDKYINMNYKSAEALDSAFSHLPDKFKQEAWNDLFRLINDKNSDVWAHLGSAFSQLPDKFKQQALNDLHTLANDEDSYVRFYAVRNLDFAFSHVPDEFKQQVWNDLYTLANDEFSNVRYVSAEALDSAFSQLPDKFKQQAWSDLFGLINDKESFVRYKSAKALGSAFSQLPDEFKQQAWNDLHTLAIDKDSGMRYNTAEAFSSAFSHVPDEFRHQAWNDLHTLSNDMDSDVRYKSAEALGSAFSHVPDEFRQQAWNDLHKLTNDENRSVRSRAAEAFSSAFSHVPDEFRQQAWIDLHRLTDDKEIFVRSYASQSVGSAFSHVPDEFKQQAWNDLHRLTNDKESFVRYKSAKALGSAFSQLPDEFKQQAWNDLHTLVNDEDWLVRRYASKALGFAFSYMPDEFKQQCWSDLQKLSKDVDCYVRIYAIHSLGKIAIFKASQSDIEDEYKGELETAIAFFEKAAKESSHVDSNPAQFCLPFYRSFHTIIFKKQKSKEEVDKYLKEAKNAVKGSKNKKILFEAVQNLAEALKEVQELENVDLEAKKDELNLYRKYFDRAVDLLIDTEVTAPFATIAMRKGLPILDRNLKNLLEEIREKAKKVCKEAKGTDTEEIAYSINSEIQKLEIGDQGELAQKLEDICHTLKVKVADLPENNYVLGRIEAMKYERSLIKQFDILLFVLGQIQTMKVVPVQEIDPKLQKLDIIYDNIISIKGEISCTKNDISKIKLYLANLVIPDLNFTKKELNKHNEMLSRNILAIEKLSLQSDELNNLIKDGLNELDKMEEIISTLPKNDDIKEFYNKLNELKQSKLDTMIQRYSAIISLLDFGKNILQLFLQHYSFS